MGFSDHSAQPKASVQIQLALDFYLTICAKAAELQRLISQIKETAKKIPDRILSLINDLCGPYDPAPQSLPWDHDQPLLTKLYRSAYQLEVADGGANSNFGRWNDLISKALLHGRHVLSAVRSKKPKEVASAISRFLKAVHRLQHLLPRLLRPFKNDENVLFFILRRYHDFDCIGGSSFIKPLLAQLQPKGLVAMQEYVISRYQARGFEELVPQIKNRMNELSWYLS